MGEVDPAFIQDPEHRPKLSITESEGIPLIDLSAISSVEAIEEADQASIEELVREIGRACEEWGFFQVINHGVSSETRQKMETAERKFFAQPLEEKVKARKDEESVFGYYDAENTKNVRDWKEVFDFSIEEPILLPSHDSHEDHQVFNRWPQQPVELREACKEYAREVEKLALKLMELVNLSLGLPGKRFHGYFKDQTTFMRLNHYPPCPSPHLALGVGRHKDGGGLTVLAQDEVAGLEVRRKTDGDWVRVKPTPNAFIINVGDLYQVWSNDKYESVEHRVMVNSEKERFSIAFFLNPAHYTLVEPLEELVDDKNPPKYKGYTWGQFMSHRKTSAYKKQDEENIQTYHFKV
ncbi:hypothetical protein UlMin_032260 [Ulmus minor]